jgi:predicted molibdopterin-dependent oxidoreductase YjgC
MFSRRSLFMLGMAGLLSAAAVGVQAKAKVVHPNFVSFGLVTSLNPDAGTFVLHHPRGPQSKRDTTITYTDQTTFVDIKRKLTTSDSLQEGQLVQVAGFKSEGGVTAAQVAIVTDPIVTPAPF